ncbi:MAG: transglycosylase SLT domain-containing protein, partial [Desulfomonilaceae bacterium]
MEWPPLSQIKFALVLFLITAPFIPGTMIAFAVNTEQPEKQAFLAGKMALDKGNPAQAEERWKPILGDNLYGPVSYLLLARGFAREGSFEKSESLIRDFLKLYPSSPYREASLEDLCEYVYQQGKPGAYKLLRQSLSNASESRKQSLLLRLGDLKAKSGEFDEALIYYRKLYLSYPAGAEGLEARKRISRLVFNGKIQKPEFTETELLTRASKLATAGRYDLAGRVYKCLAKQKSSDYGIELKLAHCLYKDRQNEEAIKLLSKLLAKDISAPTRVEVMYMMSLICWRIDKDQEFETCCEKILEAGGGPFRTKTLVNLASFHYEKGNFARAESLYKQLFMISSDPSAKAKIKWRLAWIKYRSREYSQAATAFREIREISKDPQMAKASKYWEARATTLAGKFEQAIPLYRSLAQYGAYDYYGSNAQKILVASKQPFKSIVQVGGKPFPDLRISPALKANPLVSNSLKLMMVDLPEFALLNLESLPQNIRLSYPIMFLMAKAAQQAGYYGLAHSIVASGFPGLVDNPPTDAPIEFVELAYPKVHFSETCEHAKRCGVDPLLVWAIVRQESRYDSFAVSPAGALGLMQVTPKTAMVITNGSRNSNTQLVQELLDPKKNLSVGIQLIAQNMRQFKGNV